MTAARTPILLSRACPTMVVALAIWAGDNGIQTCGPLVATGISWSQGGSMPRRARTGLVCWLIAPRTCAQLRTCGCWLAAGAAPFDELVRRDAEAATAAGGRAAAEPLTVAALAAVAEPAPARASAVPT